MSSDELLHQFREHLDKDSFSINEKSGDTLLLKHQSSYIDKIEVKSIQDGSVSYITVTPRGEKESFGATPQEAAEYISGFGKV